MAQIIDDHHHQIIWKLYRHLVHQNHQNWLALFRHCQDHQDEKCLMMTTWTVNLHIVMCLKRCRFIRKKIALSLIHWQICHQLANCAKVCLSGDLNSTIYFVSFKNQNLFVVVKTFKEIVLIVMLVREVLYFYTLQQLGISHHKRLVAAEPLKIALNQQFKKNNQWRALLIAPFLLMHHGNLSKLW